MPLIDITGRDKVQVAIERLRAFEPPEGYWLAYSGGKDSDTILALAKMAGVKFEAHYSITSVDPPEVLRHIKSHPEVQRDFPGETMWTLIPNNGVPTRVQRFCCKVLKESAGNGRVTVTGVRWAESANRRYKHGVADIQGPKKGTGVILNDENDESRRMVEQCYRTKKTLVNPIVDWLTDDVWEFLRGYGIPYCELYDQGFERLGCIGCPMNTNAAKELDRWPTYRDKYIRAFDKMLDARREKGRPTQWETGEDVMAWWLDNTRREKEVDGQMGLDFDDIWGDDTSKGEE
jgi:phosphoadenosine phosphosulfate reductase